MGRPENIDMLSRDVAQAIRYYSFNSCSEFYLRFKNELPMSKATFHRIIQGENSSFENIASVESVCDRLGIMDKTGGSSYLDLATTMRNFLYNTTRVLNDEVIRGLDRPTINDLRVFVREHKSILLQMMK